MQQKEDIDIHSIMREFDQYVESSLKKKTVKQIPEQPENQLDTYYQNMQKRLKIRTVTQDEKFEKMLGPMKNLKSFVSIKQFLRGLNQKSHKQKTQTNVISQETKRKLQYQDLRGGLYMQKVENHLKRNHLKRKLDGQAEFLLKELQQNQTQKNDYRQWMENALGKINMKEETFLRVSEAREYREESQKQNLDNNTIFADLTNSQTFNVNSNKKQNYKKRASEQQEQKNFKKVSDFLAERLKKILTDKYVNNSSKQLNKSKNLIPELSTFDNFQEFRMVTQPSTTTNRMASRASIMSKRVPDSMRSPIIRSQTNDLKNRKPNDGIWKKKINTKMDNFIVVTNNYYKRCQQEKKGYKNIVNPFIGLDKDQI